ncbi:hypothetical protein DMB90_24620 [Raoultella planticola]|uniref:Alcohol dehydrogenase-like C-terminal domain-containing protein n=1 Tax=Raoultella planticola TaxID=575 RepID=A0A5P6AAS1_RAOPL|nr:hypothetical protein DMB90_24620 [Raoultella planticola]
MQRYGAGIGFRHHWPGQRTACRAEGASTVIVSDLSRFKRELALKIGVTHAIDPANEDLETRVAEITDGKGPDVVIIAAGVSSLVSQAVNVVRRGGRVVVFSPFDKTRWWKLMPDACSGMKYPSLAHTPSPLTT